MRLRRTFPRPSTEAGAIARETKELCVALYRDHRNGHLDRCEPVKNIEHYGKWLHRLADRLSQIAEPGECGCGDNCCEVCHICKKRRCQPGEDYCSAAHIPDRIKALLDGHPAPPAEVILGIPRDTSWCGGVFATMEDFNEYNANTGNQRWSLRVPVHGVTQSPAPLAMVEEMCMNCGLGPCIDEKLALDDCEHQPVHGAPGPMIDKLLRSVLKGGS